MSALPADGTGGAVPPEYVEYVRALRRRIQERLVYPPAALRRRQQGVVEVEMAIAAEGSVTRAAVIGGVPAEPLRDAALRAVRQAAPFPFPDGVPPRQLVIRLPVVFELRSH